MPKKDRLDARSDALDVSVHLKPILGIRPGVYLTAIYGLVLSLAVFFLLFYPGLHKQGAFYELSTFPDKATVKIDGKYAGSTPCTVFVKRGMRTMEISKPFYNVLSEQLDIRGRIFGTLVVPDHRKEKRELEIKDVDGLIAWAFADFQKNPGIPRILSDTAWASAYSETQLRLYDFVQKCMFYISNENQLREAVFYLARTSSRTAFLSPNSLISLMNQIIHIKQKYDNFPSWVLLTLTREKAQKLSTVPWIQRYLNTYREKVSRYYQADFTLNPALGGGKSVSIQGVVFHSIPAGELIMGRDDNIESLGKTIDQLLPHPVSVESFFLGETEVTNRQFASFVAESPEWAPDHAATLSSEGLAGEGYLADWTENKPPAEKADFPVSSVSYHAAVAYCEWLSKKTQAAMPGYAAHLPTEAQWEWAARGGLRGMPYPLGEKPGSSVFYLKRITGPSRAGSSEQNRYGLRDMMGNVWEWCSDVFAPGAYLLSSLDPRQNAGFSLAEGPDRVVRGGSWNNQRELVKVFSRGSQPADWCTPYLGFRVALTRR